MTNLFKVEGQTLSETVNYLTFAFMFSYDWAGLTKSAIFTKGDDEYEVVLVNDAITADKHVNLSAGEWTLSVVGSTVVDAVVTKRITTTPYTFTVTQADAVEGEVFPPSVASQVVAAAVADASSAVQIAQGVRDDADAGVFKGDKGDRGDTGAQGPIGNVMYATFDIDFDTGELMMTTPDGYTGPTFLINDETGELEVSI
jgi:hypothetical protein